MTTTKQAFEGTRRKQVAAIRRQATLAVVTFAILAPILFALIVSTQNNAQTISHQFYPGSNLVHNLKVVLVDRNLGRFMAVSIGQAIIITVGKTITALLAGLAFVHYRFRGKWIAFSIVLMTLMMPTEILVIALFRLIAGFGWASQGNIGGMASITVPFLASATGTFLFRQHFASLPSELAEAARVDGASSLRFLWSILFPLSKNVIAALAVIEFIYSWNMYLWPQLILQGDQFQVVQVGLASLQTTDQSLTYGPLMAGALLASFPPVLIFLALQKPFLAGFRIEDK